MNNPVVRPVHAKANTGQTTIEKAFRAGYAAHTLGDQQELDDAWSSFLSTVPLNTIQDRIINNGDPLI